MRLRGTRLEDSIQELLENVADAGSALHEQYPLQPCKSWLDHRFPAAFHWLQAQHPQIGLPLWNHLLQMIGAKA